MIRHLPAEFRPTVQAIYSWMDKAFFDKIETIFIRGKQIEVVSKGE